MVHWLYAHIESLLDEPLCGDEEAKTALRHLQEDISAVCAARHEHGTDRSVALALQHRALTYAAQAFAARGIGDHPAWSSLVQELDALLRHCAQYRVHSDDAAYGRLLQFVRENVDALTLLDKPAAS
ncbi:MAG: hypothetical protein JO322_04790 [Candidatus Eremiobacteraeota bacterium]|nr:hypothetical protein [Candidatus Eremiobacteraeota bacterium]